MDENLFGSWLKEPADLTEQEQQALTRANQVISEVQNADVLILGAPIYNFNISTNLKAWFEHLTRAGVAFKYTDEGSVGLLDNAKKVFVISTRGGIYAEGEGDFQTPYLRYLLKFIGITDVAFINTQGLTMGDELYQQNIQNAYSQMEQIITSL